MDTGKIVGKDLDIFGENLSHKILIFSEGRGSTVGSNILYGLASKGLAPKLIITCNIELITISGAIFGNIPMIICKNEKIFNKFKNGDFVKICTIDNGLCAIKPIKSAQ
jgi:predicted aconitase with swiveling domain